MRQTMYIDHLCVSPQYNDYCVNNNGRSSKDRTPPSKQQILEEFGRILKDTDHGRVDPSTIPAAMDYMRHLHHEMWMDMLAVDVSMRLIDQETIVDD